MTSHRVDLIDKDDAWGVLLALFKQIAYPAGSDADKHFHEVRTRNRKEGNVSFSCYRSRQKRLARSRRPDQQYAFRDPSAQLLELLRLAQEFDNLFQFFLSFFHSGHVLERDFLLLHGQQPRAALAKRQGFRSEER